jgi:hypothetical protein
MAFGIGDQLVIHIVMPIPKIAVEFKKKGSGVRQVKAAMCFAPSHPGVFTDIIPDLVGIWKINFHLPPATVCKKG